MRKFRTPRRRTTRQRSGFKVSGDEKGSTCKILFSHRIYPDREKIVLLSNLKEVAISHLFKRDFGIFGVGFYFKPSGQCEVSGSVSWEYDNKKFSVQIQTIKTGSKIWKKHGALIDIPLAKARSIRNLSVELKFSTTTSIDFFGLIIGSIKHPYLEANDVYEAFCEKTSIYIPEILYIDPTTHSVKFTLLRGKLKEYAGTPIVCKSCNRCARFLPIDIHEERNTLSYSNHCASRAPCTHSAFSIYEIESGNKKTLPTGKTINNHVKSYFGHQLECKVCKKFFVNLPLNPLRDSTQHREDSLRRRAFEVLANQLLERKWIYHLYRLSKGKEFDVAIWEKFGKKCFNCGIKLKKPTEMHLDHTRPLAYLWPLDETATCLCSTCNNYKHDKFPIEFYPKEKLPLLAELTGIPILTIDKKLINGTAVKELLDKIVWFFDVFLVDRDYQKIRKGKKAADLILHSIHNALHSSGYKVDLVDLYHQKIGKPPKTVTVD